MATEIDNLVNQIVQAIEFAVNPVTPQSTRKEANEFIEKIKLNINSDFQQYFMVAFRLLTYVDQSTNNDPFQYTKLSNINNFGLQLMEFMVKFNWNKMADSSKEELKLMIENIFCKKNIPVAALTQIYDNRLLKDQFSRLLVEILMREWPQRWPNFLTDCLSQKRNELVLYTLWRLSEDIGIFYLPNNPQRRREMNGELVSNLPIIQNYMADCLILDDFSLAILTLRTLSSFFEWTQLNQAALTFLCKVLTLEMEDTDNLFTLCNSVADCFFTCLNRKSFKNEEKKALLVFFEEQNLNILASFLEKLLFFVQSKIESKVIDEKTFDLVKRICDIFSLMGQSCISICLQFSQPFPPTWPIYLQIMLKLLEYDNQIYNFYALQFWKELFRNQHIKENCVNDEMILKIINLIPYKMVKKEEMNNIFLVYEFDGVADYDVFFIRFRADFGDFLRNLTKKNEKYCFNLAISLIQQVIQAKSMNKNEWSTVSTILDAVCNNLTNLEEFSEEALSVLRFLIAMENVSDPELMNIILSSLSALSFFMQYSKDEIFKQFLVKIFSMISNFSYTKDPLLMSNNRLIRDLRRHACSIFIKLSIKYPKLLLPLFDEIRDYVYELDSKPEIELTQLEKCSLFEALIILSNHFNELHQQSEFIQQIVKPVNWLIEYNMSTADFMKYIGLTSPQSEWEQYITNRTSLIYAINIIIVIIKRVNKRNALLPAFLPYVCSLTKIIKNLNEMWSPESQQLCYPEFKDTIYAPILDNDRFVLIEILIPGIKQQHKKEDDDPNVYNVNKMQTFLWLLHENSFISIGSAAYSLGHELYYNLETVDLIHCINNLPDFKFKMIFRSCLKPLISNCPKSKKIYETKIFPLFYKFLPAFFEKINQKWNIIKEFRNNDQETDQLEAEILEEQICRSLSKEFIDFLSILLIEKSSKNEEDRLSFLGLCLLKQVPDLIYMTATLTTWLDSTISLKATTLTIRIIEKLNEEEIIKTSSVVSYLIKQVLIALSYFGEHDTNQAALLNLFAKLYENFVIKYDFRDVKTQLVEYSGQNIRSWNSYEERIINISNGKKKRDAIKGLLDNVIGKNLSQLFKQQGKEDIKNLEPIISRTARIKMEERLNSDFNADDPDLSNSFFKFF